MLEKKRQNYRQRHVLSIKSFSTTVLIYLNNLFAYELFGNGIHLTIHENESYLQKHSIT